MSRKILLIEDEEKIARFVELELTHEGYEVTKSFNGREGLTLAESGEYELILLDVMLPELNGLEVLRRLRRTSDIPVIMLTARDAVMDKVSGLDAGADDYLAKPFAAEELLARVRALSRRPAEWEQAAFRRGDVELRLQDRLLTGPAGSHTLSRRECALLDLFLRNPGVTLPRERILLNVWGPDSDVESGNIDNYIHLVRRRLRLVGSRMELTTRRGAGYCLEADKC